MWLGLVTRGSGINIMCLGLVTRGSGINIMCLGLAIGTTKIRSV
jgi:hypothetical protein